VEGVSKKRRGKTTFPQGWRTERNKQAFDQKGRGEGGEAGTVDGSFHYRTIRTGSSEKELDSLGGLLSGINRWETYLRRTEVLRGGGGNWTKVCHLPHGVGRFESCGG